MAIESGKIFNNVTPTQSDDPAAMNPANYISQIEAGETIYDIATHHSIKFYDGRTDTTGVSWNGISDLEVLIPSVADLVTDPVLMVGTVDATGTIIYNSKYTNTTAPKTGYLVYMAADCTFDGVACEAGDMAIFDGDNWVVVSGENQVTISGIGSDNEKVFSISGASTEILSVEGKSLKLNIDYSDVKAHMGVVKAGGDVNSETYAFNLLQGQTSLDSIYLSLTQGDGSTLDISKETKINLPTELKDGTVTIEDTVYQASDFSWNAGALPTLQTNTSKLPMEVSHTMSVGKASVTDGESGDFVASIDGDVLKSASLVNGSSSDYDIKYVSSLETSTSDGIAFVTGMHEATTKEELEGTADLLISGAYSVDSAHQTFVSGLSEAKTSGAVVASVEVGAVTIDNDESAFVYGLGTESEGVTGAVITSVEIGAITLDNAKNWFVTGLSESEVTENYDVVTSISIADPTLVTDATSTFASNAMVSASVSNHVLSFNTASFMKPVKIDAGAVTVKGKTFDKSGVAQTNTIKSADFVTSGISQAATTISYKDVLTDNVVLSKSADTKMYFDTDKSTVYTPSFDYKKISTSTATVSKNSYELKNTTISVNIPVGKVVESFASEGVLPSFLAGDPTKTISGTVSTELTTTETSWLSIDPTKKEMTVAGGYTLTSSSVESTDAIEVAVADTYSVSGKIAIAEGIFVTDVLVDTDAEANPTTGDEL